MVDIEGINGDGKSAGEYEIGWAGEGSGAE